ncbi:MAG: hypothetical protein JXR91_09355 [Deltaproteobacteria bacterium]|nr:hypothetical protein [Deltaproteobacteria bacterium]
MFLRDLKVKVLVVFAIVFAFSCTSLNKTEFETGNTVLHTSLYFDHFNSYIPYYISINYAPVYTWSLYDIDENIKDTSEGDKVKPNPTPWAEAWDRELIVQKMNSILIENGISSINMRVRMIAHAIVASGWKQKVWNYNAWGVKTGSWQRDYYIMPTIEEIDGESVEIEEESWRSFNNWSEAVDDYKERISMDSNRPSYRKAYSFLQSEDVSVKDAIGYWEALGEGNYFTARKFTGRNFARLCSTVRSYL